MPVANDPKSDLRTVIQQVIDRRRNSIHSRQQFQILARQASSAGQQQFDANAKQNDLEQNIQQSLNQVQQLLSQVKPASDHQVGSARSVPLEERDFRGDDVDLLLFD